MLDFNPTTDFRLLMAVPLIPLLGYIVQIFFGKHLPRKGDWMLTGGMFVVMCITVYLGFKAAPDVPLTLAAKPKTQDGASGSPMLRLQLAPDAAQTLERFTAANLGRPVAIVVGGEVVSKHKVREAITGGKLQISWCNANACEVLRLKLTD